MRKKKTTKRKSRYLEFGKPIVHARPPRATPADLVKVLGAAALGQRLPRGWDVEQTWRNGPNAPWKSEPVEQMVKRSGKRSGNFVGIYLDRFLRRQAKHYGVTLAEPREATDEEIEADEEMQERSAEREAPEFEALAKAQKRSAAARKGWATRRRAAAKQKTNRQRRSK